ncbi:hypothetical protein A2533_00980 [Candidatus Falkowbacteria bacterium RIFOXYD2_FULL_35_9]|uniref:Uncharacterized protein n=1 Tax=Candidatus Falkowbacteria bacterium RIFOXYC2_FULL_36_12 TaxID=1798002 RepID=A0A1F5SYL3_9BACT|nr:MAG: hypothetical protein A2300_01380 [Candidatus Falkowbacteria bacterium RIFOXYB2_FULL_35_7]OGF31742.1 MAG: hypothetical protein A2478_04625 [Candidatus Falkowbacteria bacterium RIFOXYC2_FULL_36_12]OGF34076.1 MAG: hypothetical protein A2223_04385 [Candidatus Falkowbacteria bacterium RIFOXYA2_FULL_35_8]OGF48434.1 MAG: hypothetical protein A2533_00980 [Candidatus Falkowbacteria bacterium RIFOXYD2_FULL_35_9]
MTGHGTRISNFQDLQLNFFEILVSGQVVEIQDQAGQMLSIMLPQPVFTRIFGSASRYHFFNFNKDYLLEARQANVIGPVANRLVDLMWSELKSQGVFHFSSNDSIGDVYWMLRADYEALLENFKRK